MRLASVPSSWQRAANAHFAVGEQDSETESWNHLVVVDLWISISGFGVDCQDCILPVPLLNCSYDLRPVLFMTHNSLCRKGKRQASRSLKGNLTLLILCWSNSFLGDSLFWNLKMNNWFYFSQAPLVVKQPANSNGFEGMNVGGGCHQRHLLPQRLRLPGRELGANGLCRRGLVKRHLGPRSWELKSVFF